MFGVFISNELVSDMCQRRSSTSIIGVTVVKLIHVLIMRVRSDCIFFNLYVWAVCLDNAPPPPPPFEPVPGVRGSAPSFQVRITAGHLITSFLTMMESSMEVWGGRRGKSDAQVDT